MKDTYNLFLDDFRSPLDSFYYSKDNKYIKLEWIIVRSYDEFIKHIIKNGLPYICSYDHDLSDIHYDGDYLDEKTGYDCIKWLCNYCYSHELKLPEYLIHSQNPIGKQRIASYIINYKKHCE